MSFVCTVRGCTFSFTTFEELAKHMKGTVHGKKSEPIQVDREGKRKVSQEPQEVLKFDQEEAESQKGESKPIIKKEEPKKAEIVLTYKYIGVHDCGTEPLTIEVDIGKDHCVIAFCQRCNKQVITRKVAKL